MSQFEDTPRKLLRWLKTMRDRNDFGRVKEPPGLFRDGGMRTVSGKRSDGIVKTEGSNWRSGGVDYTRFATDALKVL